MISDGQNSYSYNSRNQLEEFDDGSSVSTYGYAPTGLRRSKSVSLGGGTYENFSYTYDNGNLIFEYYSNHSYSPRTCIGTYYNYGPTGIISQSNLSPTEDDGAIVDNSIIFEKDAHGDVIYKLNASDYSLLTYDSNYDAFGNGGNRSYSKLGYCGEYFDNESGLIYLRARYYNSKTGRFISEDPIRDGLNWYVYCGNNPVIYIDPWGLDGYIYYLPEWESEAMDNKSYIMEYYDLSVDEVHMISITSKEDIIDNWNNMDDSYQNIDVVVINTHAVPEALQWKDTNGIWVNFDKDDIDKLENKDVGALILLGCNAGHLSKEESNVASQFAAKVNTAPVLAADGTVKFSKRFILFGDYCYKPIYDDAFKNGLNEGENRKSEGWVIYQQTGTGELRTYIQKATARSGITNLLKKLSYWQ